MQRLTTIIGAISMLVLVALAMGPHLVEACAGLIGPNGGVNLTRTTTLAAYHGGVEHYVTAFEFAGGGGQFGSLVPLPGVPTKVERGGAWTLQRLELETQPPQPAAFALAEDAAGGPKAAEVLQQVRIDALDITVLKGGGAAVGAWATEHGFRLPPDAPEVLDFYANRSPIFLAAVFDADAAAARGQAVGDGTPVHITIPTENPWVPLRILGLGKPGADQVQADLFLLTDRRPALLPAPHDGFALTNSDEASASLLDDLRGDDGMGWVPQQAWLSKIQIDTAARNLHFDLAVDTSYRASPSLVDAGLALPHSDGGVPVVFAWLAVALALGALVSVVAVSIPQPNRA
jgi:hypothetical protein